MDVICFQLSHRELWVWWQQELEGQNPVNFWENYLEDKHRRFCTRRVPGKCGLVDLVQILLFRTAQLCTGAKLISLS